MNATSSQRGGRAGTRLLALVLGLAVLGCGSLDQAEADAAKEDLIQRVGEALKNGSPPPPDGNPLEDEFTQKMISGTWDLREPDSMEDRVSPAPPDDPPAPGETY